MKTTKICEKSRKIEGVYQQNHLFVSCKHPYIIKISSNNFYDYESLPYGQIYNINWLKTDVQMILFEHNLIFSVMLTFSDVLRIIHLTLSEVVNISYCRAIVHHIRNPLVPFTTL